MCVRACVRACVRGCVCVCIGRRDQQEDWEGSFNTRLSHGSSVHKPEAVSEDKRWLSTMPTCYQHIVVWQRDMDYI